MITKAEWTIKVEENAKQVRNYLIEYVEEEFNLDVIQGVIEIIEKDFYIEIKIKKGLKEDFNYILSNSEALSDFLSKEVNVCKNSLNQEYMVSFGYQRYITVTMEYLKNTEDWFKLEYIDDIGLIFDFYENDNINSVEDIITNKRELEEKYDAYKTRSLIYEIENEKEYDII